MRNRLIAAGVGSVENERFGVFFEKVAAALTKGIHVGGGVDGGIGHSHVEILRRPS